MPPTRRQFLKATGVASAITIAGCSETVDESGDGDGGDGGGGAVTGDPGDDDAIRIGFLHPTSGGYSVLGEPQQAGAELAVEMLNAADGIDGRDVVGIHEDTASDPSTADQRAQRLIQSEDVDILTGTANSGASLAVQELAANNGIVYFNQSGADSVTRSNCNEYTFRYELRTGQEARSLARWAVENLGENIWFHHANYAYGNDFRTAWDEALDAYDLDYNVVGDTESELGTSDFATYITQMQNSDADFVALGLAGGDLVTFNQQAASYDLGSDVDIVTGTSDFMATRAGAPRGSLGQYSIVRYFEGKDTELNREFVQEYVDMHDGIPHNHAESQWTVVHQILGPAIEEAGSTAPDDLIPVLEGMQFDSPMGECELRACDHQMSREVEIAEVVDSQSFDWVPDNDVPSLDVFESTAADEAIADCDVSGCSL